MPYVPLEWLAEHVEVPAGTSAADLAAALVKVGLEPEQIVPAKVTGDLVVGRVLTLSRKVQKNGKTIGYARVDVGSFNDAPGEGAEPSELPSRGIICGAPNLEEGQHVLVALPGTVLPGDFQIAARKTYGHISDGMICSEVELGLGDDHDGIIVLDEYLAGEIPPVGTNMLSALGLSTELLEINITPDRGYCFSMRGVAREYGHSTGGEFTDPVSLLSPPTGSADGGFGVEVRDDAPLHGNVGCTRFVARRVRGVDPNAPSPQWMQKRLAEAGMRSISLGVDVTNYVMLDLGQPLHGYDLGKMREPIVVRRARPGERLTTLDDVDRALDPQDLLITDDGGERVLGLAGVMGGASTEIDENTTDVLIEAAHFDPSSVARTARRHKLPSEAAKRFERGVDTNLQHYAAQYAADLLVEYGGGEIEDVYTDLNETAAPAPVTLAADFPSRHVGVEYSPADVTEVLTAIGCTVEGVDPFVVTPPTWRPDLTEDVDLVEEVARLKGYDAIPSVLPVAASDGGLTPDQQRRRAVARAYAEHGLIEVLSYPFVGDTYSRIGVPEDDPRRNMVRLANPLADDAPYMRSTLLSTLIEVARRNVGRGNALALVEFGQVTQKAGEIPVSPLPALAVKPSDGDLAAIRSTVPSQPLHVAGIAAGPLTAGGALGTPRAVDWADAIEFAQLAGRTVGVEIAVRGAEYAPWHPGRCAELLVDSAVMGHAGELHPAVLEELDLPARTVAFELDLDALFAAAPEGANQVRAIPTFPPAKEDLALVMDVSVPAARALAVVREAAGSLAEEVRLFDDYRSEQLGEDKKSLAFALKLRAPDRTLSAEETAAVREAVIAAAASELGAHLR